MGLLEQVLEQPLEQEGALEQVLAEGLNGSFAAPAVEQGEVGLDEGSGVEHGQMLDGVGSEYLRQKGLLLDEPLEQVEPLKPFE